MNISLEGFAIGYGILTVENYSQALIRSKTVANKIIGKGKKHLFSMEWPYVAIEKSGMMACTQLHRIEM